MWILNTSSKGTITIQEQQSSNNCSTTNSTVVSALTLSACKKTEFLLNYIILAVLIVLGGIGAAKMN